MTWTEQGRLGLMVFIAVAVMVESGFTPAALTLLADRSGGRGNRGAVMGIYTALFGVGAFLGAVIASVMGPLLGVDGLIFSTIGLGSLAIIAVAALDVPPSTQHG